MTDRAAIETFLGLHFPRLADLWRSGRLDEEAALGHIRRGIFSRLEGFGRYEKLEPADVCRCRQCGRPPPVTFSREVGDPPAPALLARLRELAPPGASVVARKNVGRCATCRCRVEAFSALVSVDFAGRALSREYSLEEP